jgi:outer membrane protein assembly factor BamB
MRIFETFLLVGIAASGLYSQTDWPGYGGDPGGSVIQGSRRSIPRTFRSSNWPEAVPIMVGGVLFTPTVRHTIVALEPETGKEIWKYELGRAVAAPMRGLTYWPGDKENPAEILAGTSDGKLIALNANWRRGQDFGGVKMGRTGAHCNSTGSPG